MATMQAPRVYFGRHDSSPVLVLKGHVRYMVVRALRSFIDGLLAREQRDTLIIDLRELDGIDSTGMGLLVRLGRQTLQHGRRAVIVCGVKDVITCLRSAAFDTLFIIVNEWPFEVEARVEEVALESGELQPDILGRLMLEAHRDLASLSEENQDAFTGVITALSAEFDRERHG